MEEVTTQKPEAALLLISDFVRCLYCADRLEAILVGTSGEACEDERVTRFHNPKIVFRHMAPAHTKNRFNLSVAPYR